MTIERNSQSNTQKVTAMPSNLTITVEKQHFSLQHVFRIARGAKTQADVVVVTISDNSHSGWSEAVPYARYQESLDSVIAQINTLSQALLNTENITGIIASLPAGAARNALDCAWWDLQAKQKNTSVATLLELSPAWTIEDLRHCCQQLKALNVVLIEQPLPAGQDQELINFTSPIPLCADESCHTRAELDYLKNRYQVVNIKLDKTGGLTEAVLLAQAAKNQGFELMLGCMVGSSLAMAPIALLVNEAKFVDLDGPLLISTDRENGFEFNQGVMQPLSAKLWGGASNFAIF